MARKLKLDKTAYEALEDTEKALYIADGDGYKLDIDDSEIANEMRRARDREKVRADEAAAALAAAQTKLEEIEGNNARKSGDIEAIERSWKEKLRLAVEDAKKIEEGLKAKLAKILVDKVAQDLSHELSEVPEVLLPHIKSRLQADLDGEEPSTRVLGTDGKPSAMTLDELRKSFVDNPVFAPIIIGSKASGSGATGGNKSGGAAKQPSEYTEAERVQLFKTNPAKFHELFPVTTA